MTRVMFLFCTFLYPIWDLGSSVVSAVAASPLNPLSLPWPPSSIQLHLARMFSKAFLKKVRTDRPNPVSDGSFGTWTFSIENSTISVSFAQLSTCFHHLLHSGFPPPIPQISDCLVVVRPPKDSQRILVLVQLQEPVPSLFPFLVNTSTVFASLTIFACLTFCPLFFPFFLLLSVPPSSVSVWSRRSRSSLVTYSSNSRIA